MSSGQPTPYVVTSSNPVQVTTAAMNTVVTVYNSSTTDVLYLGSDGNPLGAFPLNPGSTLQWDASKALYLSVQGTKPVTAYVLPNGGQLTDATAIATAILNQGLANQIAQAVSAQGVPPSNPHTALINSSQPIALNASMVLPTINVTKYQCVLLQVSDLQTVTTASPTPRFIICDWMDDSGAFILTSDQFMITDTNNAPFGGLQVYTEYTLPCRSNQLRLTVGPGRASTDININAYGGYLNITQAGNTYFHVSNHSDTPVVANDVMDTVQSGLTGRQWNTVTAGSAYNSYPSHLGGPATVYVQATNVTAAGNFYVTDALDSNIVYWSQAFAIKTGVVAYTSPQLFIPPRPLRIWFDSNLAATSVCRYVMTAIR